MKEKVYVDRLFADYEDSPEIRDFKEEIITNLAARIRGLVASGLGDEEAFEKATAELGDITAIADELGKKKRNEAIGQMYMKAKVPFTKRTAGGLTAASALLMIAVGIAFITFFSRSDNTALYYVSAVLLSAACGLYTYFGLTQETAAHYAMKNTRALLYGAVCFVGVMGAGLSVVAFFSSGAEFYAAIGIKSVFILPAVCVFIFLVITEPKRQKPWLKALVERDLENSAYFHKDMVDPVKAAKFGVMSAGLWVLAIAVFLSLGFLFTWRYAWLVFPFALAVQVFMTSTIFTRDRNNKE